MNIILVAVLVVGFYCATQLRREFFPEFDLEVIMVTVPFPGATPEEVENGVVQRIEEAVQHIEGIRSLTSMSSEGMGMVILELRSNVRNVDSTLNEVKEAVDRIPSFPELAENRVVQRVKIQEVALTIGVLGPDDDSIEAALALRQVAEDLRMELLQYPRISMINLVGTKAYQIDIEIPESILRAYRMTLQQAANIVRSQNVQMPGGTIRAPSQEINVRTDNRRYDGEGIGNLPFITYRDGTVIRLRDIAYIRDEFVDGDISATVFTPPPLTSEGGGIPRDINSIAGRNVVALNVLRNTGEDLLAIVADVHEFVAKKNQSGELPPGYSLITWGGMSEEVESRLKTLTRNGLQGLIIVFILLALFLELRLAFWVALGIPFSICAAMLFLNLNGDTLNMISMFAFIMGIGIVVDDAIIAGENVYRHREMGKDYLTAVVDGIYEVCPAVISSVVTTMIALSPLLFITGTLGKIFYIVPLVLIVMLAASLFHSFLMLPCHLAHPHNLFFKAIAGYLYLFSWLLIPLQFCRRYADFSMHWSVRRIYTPAVQVVLKNRLIFLTGSLCVLALSIMVVYTGKIPFVFFPRMDGNTVQANLVFPNGTPAEVTERWTQHLERSFWKVAKEFENAGTPIAVRSFRVVGTSLESRGMQIAGLPGAGNSSTGGVSIELVSGDHRTVTSMEIADRWREAAGTVPGAESLTFETQTFGPQGASIEMYLLAQPRDMDQLLAAVGEVKAYLAQIEGIKDIRDGDVPGRYEFRLTIKERALAMGVHPAELANVIRATYYGAEVQRLQRGRHEVKVMVSYPREDRRSLGDFNEIRVRTANGEFPITELADIEVVRGFSSINRYNRQRWVVVSADVEEGRANAQQVINSMRKDFLPELLEKHPGVTVLWLGDEEELQETMDSLIFMSALALCVMFVLLSLQFKSYVQPFMVLAIIPFGWIGVVFAHWLFGLPITMPSGFGFVALAGVIINGSILMIDFINRRIRAGGDVFESLVMVGQERLRPIFLTSITTFGGLLPMMLETSIQAQVMIPMALSLAGGALFSLFFVLFFIPVLYSYYVNVLEFFDVPLHDESRSPCLETGGSAAGVCQ